MTNITSCDAQFASGAEPKLALDRVLLGESAALSDLC
jgi:hypothetical protein